MPLGGMSHHVGIREWAQRILFRHRLLAMDCGTFCAASPHATCSGRHEGRRRCVLICDENQSVWLMPRNHGCPWMPAGRAIHKATPYTDANTRYATRNLSAGDGGGTRKSLVKVPSGRFTETCWNWKPGVGLLKRHRKIYGVMIFAARFHGSTGTIATRPPVNGH